MRTPSLTTVRTAGIIKRMLLALIVLTAIGIWGGCSEDNTTPPGPPSVSLIDSGRVGTMHNMYLREMFSRYGIQRTPRLDYELIAKRTIGFFAQAMPEVGLGQTEDLVRGSINALREVEALHLFDMSSCRLLDPEGLVDYLVNRKAVAVQERQVVSEFLADLVEAGQSGAHDYQLVCSKWQHRDVGTLAPVLSVLKSSDDFWNRSPDKSKKPKRSTDEEIVLADAMGGLLGLVFGGAGAIIGSGLISYAAAIYCDKCPPEKSDYVQAGFCVNATSMLAITAAIAAIAVLATLLRRRYCLGRLWAMGAILTIIPAALSIKSLIVNEDPMPFWMLGVLMIAGLFLMLRGASAHSPSK